MSRVASSTATRASRNPRTARISLLIPTHALPPLSYRVPDRFRARVRVGTAVVAPLSGHHRLGVVVAADADDDRAREEIRDLAEDLSLPVDLVELCELISEITAVPLPTVLRAALPPGLDAARYRMLDPAPGWPWSAGSLVGRAILKRTLGREGLREAETEGRVMLVPAPPARKTVEWVVPEEGPVPDLSRAPRQRKLFESLEIREAGCTTSTLLSETGASRSALRELVRKGAVRILRLPEPAPVFTTRGDGSIADLVPFLRGAEQVVGRGGAWLWRMPTGEQREAIAAVARLTLDAGERTLVLVPEIESAERLVSYLSSTLPSGHAVASYHSGLGKDRAVLHQAARAGEVDVLVGTRTAALLPLAGLGTICVADEPNEAHRAAPGYEGLPIHVRDVALERGRIEGAGVVCLSPFPSLALYARKYTGRARVRELRAREVPSWPTVRILDLRGSGALLSSDLLDACRRLLDDGGRVGVVASRLGYATALTCNRCGRVRSCPTCDIPLTLHDSTDYLVCGRCGFRERTSQGCRTCGAHRASPTGLGVERLREELSAALGEQVGLITADQRYLQDAPLVVGTARSILDSEWDAVVLPDADDLFLGSGINAAERAFRLVYGAAEATLGVLLVQTRLPEHHALQTAARGDYPAFAAAELPRLRALGYPPFVHLASLILEGPEDAVKLAVESRLRPALEPGIDMSAPVPLRSAGGPPAWRVLLRSGDRAAAASAGALAARSAAQTRGLKVRVEVDPEEV